MLVFGGSLSDTVIVVDENSEENSMANISIYDCVYTILVVMMTGVNIPIKRWYVGKEIPEKNSAPIVQVGQRFTIF